MGIFGYARLAFDSRLWKRLASNSVICGTALGSCQESSSLRLWKWHITAYGNGRQPH